jgi:hypothetical protein
MKMIIQFEIEDIFKLDTRNKVCVFARVLNSDLSWKLTDESKLGVVRIENWLEIPRSHDKDGNIRLDLFAFLLKNNDDKDKLKVNQIVELIP